MEIQTMNEKATPKSQDVILDPVPEGVIPVDEWVYEPGDEIVTYSAKQIVVPFDEIFNIPSQVRRLNDFYVVYKDAYVKQFSEITKYINYFIKFYDKDNELLSNLLAIKYILENRNVKLGRKDFIRLLYNYIVTPTMYDKVMKMVEDNYRIDLTQKKKEGVTYYESLEFTNYHAKLLMLISIFIRIFIPIVTHYISTMKTKAENEHLIEYYRPLFDIVEEYGKVNLYQKLFNSINVTAQLSYKRNKTIWDMYEAQSIDVVSRTEEFLNKNIIVDNVYKYVFNKSIIAFNSVIIKTQLGFSNTKNFDMTYREISQDKDSEGLSYLDKLEMSAVKIDENIILLSKVNIDSTIKRIKRENRIKVSKDEVKFYTQHFKSKINTISKNLIFYYYSKYFGGYNDLNHITLKQYIKLMILMKRRLEFSGYIYLNQLITAQIEGKINNRTIHNSKFIEKVASSTVYQNIRNEKFKTINDVGKGDLIINILSSLINTSFTYVDYDNQELTGKTIEMDHDILSQEFLDFVNQI